MKKGAIVKGIINYIFAIIFAIIFALFLDANVGWFILLTLLLAPLLSAFFAYMSSGLVTVTCRMEEVLLSKGDICTMRVEVQNKSIFPTPPIAITLTDEPGIRSDKPQMLVSILSKGTKTFDVEFHAKISGKSMVGVESAKVTDYMGLFSFAIKNADYSSMQRSVAVIPDIAEVSARDDNLMKVMQSSLHMDDGEETVESNAYVFGGFPGYDNREYVPGDPLKRINWKQSAKKNKLLVRLDDEMTSRAVNVVLDSVFSKDKADVEKMAVLLPYVGLKKDEILPKMAEDAVENALGMMQVFIRHNYAVNFYAMMNGEFRYFEIQDEMDLEGIRLQLAHYYFANGADIQRLPVDIEGFAEKAGVLSTPNTTEEATEVLESVGADMYTTIFAVPEEARKQGGGEMAISLLSTVKSQKEPTNGFKTKIKKTLGVLWLPYLLGLLLSTIVFAVFDVPFFSGWTVAQAVFCLAIVLYCEAIREHKVIGTMLTTVLVLALISTASRQAFGDGLLNYMHWFMSGGESVPTTNAYLISILLMFSSFFAMSVYYFIRILYRTSFLMLISLIPFVVFVKVMLSIQLVQVVFVTVLNVAAFLLHYRREKDAGKPIIGYLDGWISIIMYASVFVLAGLAVPEMETKYYYLFENAFLGGNVSELLPPEYSEMSEYSGNADGFNELNDRKLYVIRRADSGQDIYLNRQTFDYYDFEYNRWYGEDFYSDVAYNSVLWESKQRDKNLTGLYYAFEQVQQYEPKILEKYGVRLELNMIEDGGYSCLYSIEATNFPSAGFITPPNTLNVAIYNDRNNDNEKVGVTRAGIFQLTEGRLPANVEYVVEFFEEQDLQRSFLRTGLSNMDWETSRQMLTEMQEILIENEDNDPASVVERYLMELSEAEQYYEKCMENTELIPQKVKELAEKITENCVYDWEKAAALQNYFRLNDFVYDLSYKAPDDSVEYFLFEGKTGTCSDFASAYVLMARSVGLAVRYVEGFVPEEEYNGDYVVRTSCGHAYPEVYIPNVGYMIFEATVPSGYVAQERGGLGIVSYLGKVLLRLIVVFAAISLLITVVLFIHFVASPYMKEWLFRSRLKKAAPDKAVVMVYRRIQRKYTKAEIINPEAYTPYEYADEFWKAYEYSFEELCLLVERAAYTGESLTEEQKESVLKLYEEMREVIGHRRRQKKNRKEKKR